ncbi:MAG: hypothetical protein CMF22_11735 [Idiomarinaceae bacterium]|nr:hypothetical protein [Idiomarinaceae bacterium]
MNQQTTPTTRESEFTTFRHYRSPRADIASLTVCVRRFGENPTHMSVSWSICSPKDQFSRKVGRELALDRMSKGQCVIHKINPKRSMALNTIDALYDGEVSIVVRSQSAGVAQAMQGVHTLLVEGFREQAIQALENVAFIEAALHHEDGEPVPSGSDASILDNVLARVVANELSHRGIEAAKLIGAV